MRGKIDSQQELVTIIALESFVPQDHPLRHIKKQLDFVLKTLSPTFDRMYDEEGRPSIPPERLLKAKVLIALTLSVASGSFVRCSSTTCYSGGFWIWR